MKNTKKNNATSTATKTTKRSKATAEVIETPEVATPEIVESNAPAIDAPANITETEGDSATVPTEQVCTECNVPKPLNTDNFSQLLSGKFRNLCKPCQTAKANEWTSRPEIAEMRKVQAEALKYQAKGVPVVKPTAKEYTPGMVLMTLPYAILDGQRVPFGTEGAEQFPARVASEVYAEKVAAETARREEAKAQRDAILAEAKAVRDAERAELKAQRDAERAAAAETARIAKEEAKAQKAAEKAEAAEAARLAREEAARVKAEERAAQAIERAEAARIERERKATERAEAAAQKALEKAAEAEAKRQAAIDATIQKTLGALKGEAVAA